jgi:hypothetical protein
VVDDRATLDTNGAGRYPFLAISEHLRLGIARCGVPYRVYLLEDLALFNDMLQSLRRFAIINTMGIIKITKKHDKHHASTPVQPAILPIRKSRISHA